MAVRRIRVNTPGACPGRAGIMSDKKDSYTTGMQIRREMFGAAGAEDRIAAATEFNRPFEEVVTEYCFGDTWSRPGLDRKTRSMITLAALAALVRPNQIKTHVRGALANGVTPEEIREILMHTAVYAGIPAGVEAINAAAEVLPAPWGKG
jgi:4-carboxymuconolactone decarboxylase